MNGQCITKGGGRLPGTMKTKSSFDSELYVVYTLLNVINVNTNINQNQGTKITIYIDNQYVLSLIDTHQFPEEISYNQQGYNVLWEIITINQHLRHKIKWEWVHSHQLINTPGEWENDQSDKIAS